jgi:hypothetical protein
MPKYNPRPRKRTKKNKFAENRRAFVDVFGDPKAQPEAIPGQYQTLKSRGNMASALGNIGEGKTTKNMASPCIVDFFCDVDKVVRLELNDEEYKLFAKTYIYEVESGGLTDNERNNIEQRLGKLFRLRGISPVVRYFMAFRKKHVKENQNGGTKGKRQAGRNRPEGNL